MSGSFLAARISACSFANDWNSARVKRPYALACLPKTAAASAMFAAYPSGVSSFASNSFYLATVSASHFFISSISTSVKALISATSSAGRAEAACSIFGSYFNLSNLHFIKCDSRGFGVLGFWGFGG